MKSRELKHLHVVCDGGSKGNPGPSYGSMAVIAVQTDGTELEVKRERLDFGKGTNNEAEYKALIAALKYLQGLHKRMGGGWKGALIHMDSALVVQQLNDVWACKKDTLQPLHQEAQTIYKAMPDVVLAYTPRKEIVKILGH